jgi:dTDP-glucose 4,6-dehydratase
MKEKKDKRIIITGGAGFIGSALARYLYEKTNHSLLIIDKMTYAGNLNSLKNVLSSSRVHFTKSCIGNKKKILALLKNFKPDFIFNLAAETHVDNSIDNPNIFIQTNIVDTHHFLNSVLSYYNNLTKRNKDQFKIIHISTDEVYGDIPVLSPPVQETYPYQPSSPYSASKASSDHLFKSYFKTFGLPVIITNCSNNFGPFQNKEKFIPVIINNLSNGTNIPLYGDGMQKRDWLYVNDHCSALHKVLERGKVGESYNIGSGKEITNIELIKSILKILKKKRIISKVDLNLYVNKVADRLGHDIRYSIDSTKLRDTLNWKPENSFEHCLNVTVDHYLRFFEI